MRRLRDAVTVTHQCWLFAVGSTLFAIATVPGAVLGVSAANALCFAGSWFFTTAGWIQLVRSGPEGSAEWLSAATQFTGTVLFNVSTGAAVAAHEVSTQRRLVWMPDVVGSIAFLASGALALAAVGWWTRSVVGAAAWVNMAGCLAFGASAAGAFVLTAGGIADQAVATAGTFVGALCFLVAALMGLPRFADG